MIELKCLTFDEEETLNSVLYRNLGRAIGSGDKAGKLFIKDIVIKQEPDSMAEFGIPGTSDETEMGTSEPKMDQQTSNKDESVPGTDPSSSPETRSKENVHDKDDNNLSVLGTDPGEKRSVPMDTLSVLGTDPGKRANMTEQGNKPTIKTILLELE